MDYYLKIENDSLKRIFNDEWTVNGGILEKWQGAKLLQEPLANLQLLSIDESLRSRAGSPDNYIVDQGVARLMTDSEYLEEHEKSAAKQNAKQLYHQLKQNTIIEFDGDLIDLTDAFYLDYQMRKKSDNIRVLTKHGKSKSLTKAKASELELAVATYKEALLNDHDADIQDIEDNVDLSCPRLTARLQG